jgi:pilus assembly protein Flp/PilA
MLKQNIELIKFYLSALKEDPRGLTTVEYAVAGALIAGSVVVAFTELGDQVEVAIDNLTAAITP